MSQKLSLALAAMTTIAVGLILAWPHMVSGSTERAPQSRAHLSARLLGQRYVFPLKLSANRRYLVDQANKPFLIVGDSPQALIGNLSVSQAAAYIANRKRAGFNALWV